MRKTAKEDMWIAVRVQGGFVTEVRAYWDETSARRRERAWRTRMNPDYDETGVQPIVIPPRERSSTPSKRRDSEARGPKR